MNNRFFNFFGNGHECSDYQDDFIHLCLKDSEFFKENIDVIDQNYFQGDYRKRVLGIMKDLYRTNGFIPSKEGILLFAELKHYDAIFMEELEAYLSRIEGLVLTEDRIKELKGSFIYFGSYIQMCRIWNEIGNNLERGFESATKFYNSINSIISGVEELKRLKDSLPCEVGNKVSNDWNDED